MSRNHNATSPKGNDYVWYRPEFMERLDELASFAECGAVLGGDGPRTVSTWHNRYEDFPQVVCAAGDRPAAKKYLVKLEFADWLVQHEAAVLEREEELYRRLLEDATRVSKRVSGKTEDLRVAKALRKKWSTH